MPDKKIDAETNTWLAKWGWRVPRLWGHEVRGDLGLNDLAS